MFLQFRDLQAQYVRYREKIDAAVQHVMHNANFIDGQEVNELENRLAEYVGVKHCVTCANGTDALSLVLMAWDIKEGDAIFVPDFTFFATAEVVSFCGATPIFVDVCPNTFNIDPTKLEKVIIETQQKSNLNPKVIIPVDMFGLPANYSEIEAIAHQYNLYILEDGAQGFGGSINGRQACSFGDAATTSFFPAKPLGCYGDGGAIFTNDGELAQLLKSLKVHGRGLTKYDNIRIGINSRLDTIQAAILNVKLDAFIQHELEDVNQAAQQYNHRLKEFVDIPYIPSGYYSSYAQYTIQCENKKERDLFQRQLKNSGIPSMIYYPIPMHKQKALSNYKYNDDDFEVTNRLCERVLSLPIHPYISKDEIQKVTDILLKVSI